MKKFVIGFVMVAIVAAALVVTAGSAFAQSNVPPVQQNAGFGPGGGRGGRGMGGQLQGTQTGLLHDEQIAYFAGKLGLTVDALNARLASGETLAQIAYAQGFTAEQFSALMAEGRAQAIDQAVAAGEITQEQADWMQQRGARIGGTGRGAGQGRNANANCPYATTTTP